MRVSRYNADKAKRQSQWINSLALLFLEGMRLCVNILFAQLSTRMVERST